MYMTTLWHQTHSDNIYVAAFAIINNLLVCCFTNLNTKINIIDKIVSILKYLYSKNFCWAFLSTLSLPVWLNAAGEELRSAAEAGCRRLVKAVAHNRIPHFRDGLQTCNTTLMMPTENNFFHCFHSVAGFRAAGFDVILYCYIILEI